MKFKIILILSTFLLAGCNNYQGKESGKDSKTLYVKSVDFLASSGFTGDFTGNNLIAFTDWFNTKANILESVTTNGTKVQMSTGASEDKETVKLWIGSGSSRGELDFKLKEGIELVQIEYSIKTYWKHYSYTDSSTGKIVDQWSIDSNVKAYIDNDTNCIDLPTAENKIPSEVKYTAAYSNQTRNFKIYSKEANKRFFLNQIIISYKQ